jgi:hypothetical protein
MTDIESSVDVYRMLASNRADGKDLLTRDTNVTIGTHVVRHAVDRLGLPLLIVPLGVAKPNFDFVGNSLSVATSKDGGELFIRCLDSRLTTQFGYLADDVLRELAVAGANVAAALARVFENWSELFSQSAAGVLSVSTQIGLLAELRLLEALLLHDPMAFSAWTGPSGARHDFQGTRNAVEAKATAMHHEFRIQIHGFWQLEPPDAAELWVYAERVERTESAQADSLVNVVERIHRLLNSHHEFESALASLGLQAARLEIYKNFRFAVLEQRLCLVDSEFPRIAPALLSDSTLGQIPEMSYAVNIGSVKTAATGGAALALAAESLLANDA